MKEDNEFIDMLRARIGADNPAWPVVTKMANMLEGNADFEEMMDICEGVEKYKEFLTEKEAKDLVTKLENYDKTNYPKWPNPNQVFDAVKSIGGEYEEPKKYNKWALFFAMNMIHSDYGGVLSTMAQGADYAKLCYKMAVAWLTDPDREHSIRQIYSLEC